MNKESRERKREFTGKNDRRDIETVGDREREEKEQMKKMRGERKERELMGEES